MTAQMTAHAGSSSSSSSKASTVDRHAQPQVKYLIVDSSPLLTSPLSSLRGMAMHYLVTPDVVKELRDTKGREVMREAELQLVPTPSSSSPNDNDTEGDSRSSRKSGFEIREPTLEAVAKITAFARKTGDISVLSITDIRVLALCLTLELQENGSWRVRDTPGQVLTGPPPLPPSVLPPTTEGGSSESGVQNLQEGKSKKEDLVIPAVESLSLQEPSVRKVGNRGWEKNVDQSKSLGAMDNPDPSSPSPSSTPREYAEMGALGPKPAGDLDKDVKEAPHKDEDSPVYNLNHGGELSEEQDGEEQDSEEDPESEEGEEEEEEVREVSTSSEDDEDAGDWITPENVKLQKVKDLGLFTPPTAASSSSDTTSKVAPKSMFKAALLTGDFAMQNVALQMGLNVLGSGGKRIREVRTWVLRCHACFKICKNPEKRFCPSCGGPTLIRTSITYVPATPENPKGYILHLKKNFQYRLRGTRYNLPNPKMGKAGGGVNADLVLREDQKEWIRGVKSADVIRSKETRAILRSVMDDKKKGLPSRTSGVEGGAGGVGLLGGWNDPDWVAPMARGEHGRKRGGKNGAGGQVRLDSSGMPVIGAGRKNPNESRKRH